MGSVGSDMSLLSGVGKKSILHKPSRPLETETKENDFYKIQEEIFHKTFPEFSNEHKLDVSQNLIKLKQKNKESGKDFQKIQQIWEN